MTFLQLHKKTCSISVWFTLVLVLVLISQVWTRLVPSHHTLGIPLSFPLLFKFLMLVLVLISQVWTRLVPSHHTLGIPLSFPLLFKFLMLVLVLISQVWTRLVPSHHTLGIPFPFPLLFKFLMPVLFLFHKSEPGFRVLMQRPVSWFGNRPSTLLLENSKFFKIGVVEGKGSRIRKKCHGKSSKIELIYGIWCKLYFSIVIFRPAEVRTLGSYIYSCKTKKIIYLCKPSFTIAI